MANKGWSGESQRHALSARGIPNKMVTRKIIKKNNKEIKSPLELKKESDILWKKYQEAREDSINKVNNYEKIINISKDDEEIKKLRIESIKALRYEDELEKEYYNKLEEYKNSTLSEYVKNSRINIK